MTNQKTESEKINKTWRNSSSSIMP